MMPGKAVAALSFCLLLLPFLRADEPARPNIIVIMADDLGYGDLSCYGAKRINTPQIDQLASEGLRFTSGYCVAATCTPSRYSLLTGTYAFRSKDTGIAAPNSPSIIKPGTPTIASMLQSAGYRTAIIGKWHLGLGTKWPYWNGDLKPGPLELGFEHCLILPTTNDRVPQVLVENHRVRHLDPSDPLWVGNSKPAGDHPSGTTHPELLRLKSHGQHNNTIHNGIGRIGFYTGGTKARFRDEDLADLWIEAFDKWIEAHKSSPFFLLFTPHSLHAPRIVHERFQGKSALGSRGDAILELDWQVGRITEKLQQLNLTRNTLIVFCSDNGPVIIDGYKDDAQQKNGDHTPAGPFRGGKYNIYEGGTRTPFIVRWPERIKPAASDKLISSIDLYASLAKLLGQKLPEQACLDSFELSSTLLGIPESSGREYIVQQDNGGMKLGYRTGQFKYVRWPLSAQASEAEKKAGHHEQLFDLAADPGETKNLSAQESAMTRHCREALDKILLSKRTRSE
jgi:arylsulfatase A-like enzyme